MEGAGQGHPQAIGCAKRDGLYSKGGEEGGKEGGREGEREGALASFQKV